MKLLGKRIVYRELPKKEVQKTSIIIVPTKDENPFVHGVVVAVGDKVKPASVGATILVNKYDAGQVEWEGEMLGMVDADSVIAME